MPIPSFEDRWSKYSASGYAATNEEPELFRRLLKGKKFRRVATIASAGEIPMLVLLSVAKEVVAVDHSYRSLCVCFIKALMLELMGPKEMKRFLIEESYQDFCKMVIARILPMMPDQLRKHITDISNTYHSFNRRNGKTYYFPDGSYRRLTNVPKLPFIQPDPLTIQTLIAHSEYNEIRREWQWVNPNRLSYIAKNLHRIRYVHGDVSDLLPKKGEKEEQFDLLYISNALDHGTRPELSRKSGYSATPDFKKWAPLIRPGGFLMAASQAGKIPNDLGFARVKVLNGIRTSWLHELMQHQLPKAVKA